MLTRDGRTGVCDGQLVCFHDDTLQCVTSAAGPVRSKPLRELRALRINGAEPIPTFDEALDSFPSQCFSVDLKDGNGITPLVKSLQRNGVADRVCVAGARDGWLAGIWRHNATTAERFDRVVTTTRFAAQKFTRIRIHTKHVPLGVDLEQFRPHAQHHSGGVPLLVLCSRLSREKRPDLAVETCG